MKNRLRISALLGASAVLTSCVPSTSQQGGGTGAGGVYQDPNNPYAVPGVSTQGGGYSAPAQPNYQAPTTTAPYQPIPTTPINPPATIPSSQGVVSTPTSSTGGSSHTITSGDSLWGLSRKYGVSVDELRQANGISGDKIVTGQTLKIP